MFLIPNAILKWKKKSFHLRLSSLNWFAVPLYLASPSCRANALTVDTHTKWRPPLAFAIFCGVVRILYSLVSLCGVLFGVLLMYV